MKIPFTTALTSLHYKLRMSDESDVDFTYSATRYPGFNDGMPWDPPNHKDVILNSLKKTPKRWKEGTDFGFTIESIAAQPERLGRISIRQKTHGEIWDVGYWTHPAHHSKGIMTEVLGAILDFGFTTLQAEKITASCATWNKASEKVLTNNGFKFIKHIEQGFQKKGQWVSENQFAITRHQWKTKKPPLVSSHFSDRLKDNPNTIFTNEHIIALLDIDPIALGHILIFPKKHYVDFHELPDDLVQEMMVFAKKAIRLFQTLFPAQGYSMMLNGGAFNDLKHCHLHVFPRYSKEEFGWTYDESKVSVDAKRFEVLKDLMRGYEW